MNVTYLRGRRPGPEALVEDAVASRLADLMPAGLHNVWVGGSVPLGAGVPDLVVVRFRPNVCLLAHVAPFAYEVLAYLRFIKCARLETIAASICRSIRATNTLLKHLVLLDIVVVKSDTFSLAREWRNILPDIVTVEVKISNWQKALQQAFRNRVFAHQSFIALPERVAMRISDEPLFDHLGVGIVSVDASNEIQIVRDAEKGHPKVWSYYYKLAMIAAHHSEAFAIDV